MAAAASRKRPAHGGSQPARAEAAIEKRVRYMFGNITADHEYELLEEIRRSAHGVVLRGSTGETVAVKRILGGDGLRAVAREIDCIQVKDAAVDEATGDLFVLMELAGGDTLRSRMAWRGPLPEDEARACMRQLLRVAARAHGAGLVHGDINPDNVLVGADGALKLCGGFGCPEECQLGTMQYRSPELLNSACLYDGPAADVFALGCVMYELVTGSPLFRADTEEGLLEEAEELHDALIDLEEGYDGLNLGDLSLPGKEVLSGLLQFHDCKRLTAAAALRHPWFTE